MRTTSWKTIRVFISSTFRDMQAERDWLVRFVFPKLREELLKYRIHFVDVDLRWGVTSDQDALGVCREVIDECHPRFMCILGGRYGWVPDRRTESITADEIHYGVLGRDAAKRGNSFFYFRDPDATKQMVEEKPGDFREPDGSDGAKKLAALKNAITDAKLPVFIYPARWDVAQKRLTALEKFGEQVQADLLQSLKVDPELAERFSGASDVQPDEFATEADQMEAFIEERTERYIIGSREPLLREIKVFAAADGAPNVFVVTGEPGSGKSAFLANATRALSAQTFVIPHFIGASAGSTDLRRTLRRLCHELAKAAENTEPLPLDIKDLITHFQELLTEAAGKKRVIIVLDALNQFDATDGAHWMNWLPRELPPNVRIVASVIAPVGGEKEHQTLAILRSRPGTRIVNLESLTETDTLAIIEGYLRRYSKRLSKVQIAALFTKPAGRLPLYVLTALEELRTLGTYEEITARIRELPGDARAFFGWILTERLARDPGFRDREGRPCGAALVEKFAACLGVSRHGLSPAELNDLLDPGDPLGNVAALLRLLRPYLMRRGELLDFYHGQFRDAAGQEFLTDTSRISTAHELAEYYLQKGDPLNNEQWKGDRRALGELMYYLELSGKSESIVHHLIKGNFLIVVLKGFGWAWLIGELEYLVALPDATHGTAAMALRQILQSLRDIQPSLNGLSNGPIFAPQALRNDVLRRQAAGESIDISKAELFPAPAEGSEQAWPHLRFEWLNGPGLFSQIGKVSVVESASDRNLALTAGTRLCLWDLKRSRIIQTFGAGSASEEDHYTAVAFSEARDKVFACKSTTVEIWNILTGQLERSFETQLKDVMAFIETPRENELGVLGEEGLINYKMAPPFGEIRMIEFKGPRRVRRVCQNHQRSHVLFIEPIQAVELDWLDRVLIQSSTVQFETPAEPATPQYMTAGAYDASNCYLLIGGDQGGLRLYDRTRGNALIASSEIRSLADPVRLFDRGLVQTGTSKVGLGVDYMHGNRIQASGVNPAWVQQLISSPVHGVAVAACADGSLRVFQMPSLTESATIDLNGGFIKGLKFLTDNRLWAGTQDGDLWDIELNSSGQLIQKMRRCSFEKVISVFSPLGPALYRAVEGQVPGSVSPLGPGILLPEGQGRGRNAEVSPLNSPVVWKALVAPRGRWVCICQMFEFSLADQLRILFGKRRLKAYLYGSAGEQRIVEFVIRGNSLPSKGALSHLGLGVLIFGAVGSVFAVNCVTGKLRKLISPPEVPATIGEDGISVSQAMPGPHEFAVSQDGVRLAVHWTDGTIDIVRLDVENAVSERRIEAHKKSLGAVTWISATTLIAADKSGVISRYSLSNPAKPGFETECTGAERISKSPTGQWLIVISKAPRRIYVLDNQAKLCFVEPYPMDISDIVFSADEKLFYVTDSAGNLAAYSVHGGVALSAPPTPASPPSPSAPNAHLAASANAKQVPVAKAQSTESVSGIDGVQKKEPPSTLPVPKKLWWMFWR